MVSLRSGNLRRFFASYVSATAKASDPRIEQAFATVEREPFVGPGPWSVFIAANHYIQTPDDDPAYIYQDILVALDAARGIHIGHPSSHARWLNALALVEGETVLQVGAGVGYYTAILAHLVGPAGKVHAFEIDEDFAARAKRNLEDRPWVEVQARSGIVEDLPKVDAIYVNASVTHPAWSWLDALRPGGRLLFPLHGVGCHGGMVLIKKPEQGFWPAHVVSRAQFVSCSGLQDEEVGQRLVAAYATGTADKVRSFRTDEPKDETCWVAGNGWWLSTASADEPPPA